MAPQIQLGHGGGHDAVGRDDRHRRVVADFAEVAEGL
jgi:hypothetical protein